MVTSSRIVATPLAHLGMLRLAGADAIAFLQGQVSNDTTPLARGAPVLAALSTAQGRVIAILHLLPHSSGILALLPRDLAAATAGHLRRFVLRSKVRIEDLSGHWSVAGTDAGALRAAGLDAPDSGLFEGAEGIAVARLRHGPPSPSVERYWLIGASGAVDAATTPDGSPSVWRLSDIREGLPQVYAATSELFVAQMLNLDLIGGISFTKGCYTGQEIIARTQHLGRIKRRMARLRLPSRIGSPSWSLGEPLRLADGRTGRLTEIAPCGAGERFEALAVLTLEATAGAAGADSAAGGHPAGTGAAAADAAPVVAAEELPLPYPIL